MWQTIVLITKGGRFRGIGLVEVLWKTITSLLDRWITAAIYFHDALRGFGVGQGMVTAALEDKILQHLTSMREAVIFKVLLYIWKA